MKTEFFIVGDCTGVLQFWFFFSSRSRHTRFDCDWSSDVCSSDLLDLPCARNPLRAAEEVAWWNAIPKEASASCRRSEERRVGKECGSGLWPVHRKKKNHRGCVVARRAAGVVDVWRGAVLGFVVSA